MATPFSRFSHVGESLLHLHFKVSLVRYKILGSDVFPLVIIFHFLPAESIAVENFEESLFIFPLYTYYFCLYIQRNFLYLINPIILLEYVLVLLVWRRFSQAHGTLQFVVLTLLFCQKIFLNYTLYYLFFPWFGFNLWGPLLYVLVWLLLFCLSSVLVIFYQILFISLLVFIPYKFSYFLFFYFSQCIIYCISSFWGSF